jgi:hypothetical protein
MTSTNTNTNTNLTDDSQADTGIEYGTVLEPGAADDEPYVASLTSALVWARTAKAGEYLVEYEDTGMTDVEDPGSRCGYSDLALDEIGHVLLRRNLTLTADDRGLVAQSVVAHER